MLTVMISAGTIKEFQEAVKDEYGLSVDETEAREILDGLVGYFDTLAKIAHREKAEAQKS